VEDKNLKACICGLFFEMGQRAERESDGG